MKIAVLLTLALAFASVRAASAANPVVVLDTSMGEITIELDEAKAPITVKNFVEYVKAGHYDGTIFHRVIENFMIQGGGMEPGMREKKTRDPIKNESSNGLTNARGTIAMARTNDPDSATAQFFISVKDNTFLDKGPRNPGGYCVFGKVTAGMDVVDKIKAAETTTKGGHQDVPSRDIVIKSAKLK